MTHDVAIAGGGIAGCCAAIQLANAGYRTIVIEKGRYPRHKLCGEFLSTEAAASFESLGVLSAVLDAGAVSIRRTVVTTPHGAVFRHELPGTALGLSRYELDRILAAAAQAAGAILITGDAVKSISGSFASGFTVSTDPATFDARAVLCAHGKRSALDRGLGRKEPGGSRWVAYKQHYCARESSDAIELHRFDGGYCGISPIEDGQANVCWIQRESTTRKFGGDLAKIVAYGLRGNARLAARLDAMTPISGTIRAISRPPLGAKSLFEGDICMIGDAAGMIAPFCGDGMSMAMKSASMAASLLADCLSGATSVGEFRHRYRTAWNAEFRTRLAIGRIIQEQATNPTLTDALVGACANHPALAKWLIARTRG